MAIWALRDVVWSTEAKFFFFETLIYICQTRRRKIPEDRNQSTHHPEDLRCTSTETSTSQMHDMTVSKSFKRASCCFN